VLSLLVTGCGGTKAKTYTIGIVNYNPALDLYITGFKAGMGELGYVEGKNLTYIYSGALKNDEQVIAAEVKRLMDQKVDLFFTLGTPTTVAAKKAVAGTKIPVVFAPIGNPVADGVVASIRQPGGNVTGVQVVNAAPKALTWLVKIIPGTKKVHVPYNPIDQTSVSTAKLLPETASQLGIELALVEVNSSQEEMNLIRSLPKDAAVFFVPSPSLDGSRAAVRKLAMELGIPIGGYNQAQDDIVYSYTIDKSAQGKQAARLADQIFKGTNPGDLPVETGEFFLIINLKTAQTIGLNIPDEILRQADTVIR